MMLLRDLNELMLICGGQIKVLRSFGSLSPLLSDLHAGTFFGFVDGVGAPLRAFTLFQAVVVRVVDAATQLVVLLQLVLMRMILGRATIDLLVFTVYLKAWRLQRLVIAVIAAQVRSCQVIV